MIFLTGATGFLGSYVAYFLLNEYEEISAIKRKTSSLDQLKLVFDFMAGEKADSYLKRINWIEADLMNEGLLFDILGAYEKVYHTAAMVSYNPSRKKEILSRNITGTANLVDASIENGIKEFHYVSSIAALERKQKDLINERQQEFERDFPSAYAESKFRAEQEVWRGYAEGLEGVIINPSLILGPGDYSKSSPRVFQSINKGMPFYPPGYASIVDVRDVASFFIDLSKDKKFYGERYVLSAESMPYKDFFTLLATELGVKAPGIAVNTRVAWFYGLLQEMSSLLFGKEPSITRELAKSASKKYEYDNAKVKEALNKDFWQVTQTIKETVEHFKRTPNG